VLNTSTAPVTGHVTLGIYSVPQSAVTVKLTPFHLSYDGLNLPARSRSRFSGACELETQYQNAAGTRLELQVYFMRQPMLRAEFFARGFRLERPDRSQVTVADRLEIALDNSRGQFISASFSPKGVDSDMPDRCQIRNGPKITANCSFPAVGVYSVLLFANTEEFGTFQHIATLEAVRR